MIGHATEPGVICWREADAAEVSEENGAKRIFKKEEVLAHVPVQGEISKEALRSKANRAGIPINKVNGLIAELLDDGLLFERRVKRPGIKPLSVFARSPELQPELYQ